VEEVDRRMNEYEQGLCDCIILFESLIFNGVSSLEIFVLLYQLVHLFFALFQEGLSSHWMRMLMLSVIV
jgi:hypothetical protein